MWLHDYLREVDESKLTNQTNSKEESANLFSEVDDKKNVSARFNKIGAMGELEIQFNSSMVIPQNLSWINETVVDIYIIPSKNISESDYEENMLRNCMYVKTEEQKLPGVCVKPSTKKDLNFTWDVVSFETNTLKL